MDVIDVMQALLAIDSLLALLVVQVLQVLQVIAPMGTKAEKVSLGFGWNKREEKVIQRPSPKAARA